MIIDKKDKYSGAPILSVRNLSIEFEQYDRGWNRKKVKAITSLDADVYAGEILAVVGASGSGKSLLAHSVLGILPGNAEVSGEIKFMGQKLDDELCQKLRGSQISLIPQSVDFLDPLMKVGRQVCGVRGSMERAREVLARYGLGEEVMDMYPHQLSGGMARRVLIAAAVMDDAELIIADEPTPGLDVEKAMETLSHFRQLADEGRGILLITHDIDMALEVADRIAVFYDGTTVETCTAAAFREGKLQHPYSRAFFDALPQSGFNAEK